MIVDIFTEMGIAISLSDELSAWRPELAEKLVQAVHTACSKVYPECDNIKVMFNILEIKITP